MTPLAVSMADAAELLGVSRDHVRRLISSGEIKASRSGARLLVHHAELIAYLERTAS